MMAVNLKHVGAD